ncbi:MAG TPA: PqiC family protein [Opitutaceae bacterium]|nr:PqiC family protein [Opitutaceae bacterium]
MKTNHGARRPILSGTRFPVSGFCLLVLSLGMLTSCSIPLPQAQPDLTRYFVLQPAGTPAGAAALGSLPVVRLQAVDVPAYLADKPLAVRRGANEIRYLDAARWAEPLDQDLARNLRLGLGATPGLTVLSRYDSTGKWDYNLKVRVTACEGTEEGHVRFAADWVLEPAPDSTLPRKAGTFWGRDLTWDGKTPAALVAALSQGVSQLCDTLVAALPPTR